MKLCKHESVLSQLKIGTMIMVLKLTAIQGSTLFCECPLPVSIRLAWTSCRWPPHTTDSARRVATFCIEILIYFVVSALSLVLLLTSCLLDSSSLGRIHFTSQKAAETEKATAIGVNALFHASLLSYIFQLHILSQVQCAQNLDLVRNQLPCCQRRCKSIAYLSEALVIQVGHSSIKLLL